MDDAPAMVDQAPSRMLFSRKATGLVRDVSLVQMVVYNAASTNPLGQGLVSFTIGLVVFPRANPYIALLVTTVLCLFVWTAFALLTAAIPRVGGDYTINTRILSPGVALGANLAQALSALAGAVIVSWAVGTLALSPALTVIGTVTHTNTFVNWGNDLSTAHQTTNFIVSLVVLGVLSLLSVLGTRFVVRAMTVLFFVAVVGLALSVIVTLFTSHGSFVHTVNAKIGPGTYAKTVAAGAKSGLYPDHGGYSTSSTIGCCYYAFLVLIYVFWGTYMSAEFKGAGQRRRQLIAMNSTGLWCFLSLVALIFLFTHVVGYDFFVSSLAGNFNGVGNGAVGAAGYVYFSALVASSSVLVVIIGLSFVGWFLPSVYINLSMPQRAILTWALDGLLPRRLGAVNERTHTPVIAMTVCFVICIPISALLSYSSNFIAILGVTSLFSYFSIVLVGVSAAVVKWRRPDLYRGSPAEWRVAGIEVLPIAGAGCALVGAFAVFLVLYYHGNLGIKYFHAMEIAAVAVLAFGFLWFFLARAARSSQGLDLGANYRAIPPD
jgi:amino acid transporter